MTAANALSKLLRLQQIAAGFAVLDQQSQPDSTWDDSPIRNTCLEEISTAKRNLLGEVLEEIGPDERVVVFCRFHHDLNTIRDICDFLERPYLEISGRRNQYADWKNMDGYPVVGVQLQAGSLGIDLTEARYAIFYTLGFSLGDYQQSVARLYRPGQEQPVVVCRLLADRTVDRKILKALDKRRDVIRAILDDINA